MPMPMRKNGTPYRELNTYIGRKYKYANNKANIDHRILEYFVKAHECTRNSNQLPKNGAP